MIFKYEIKQSINYRAFYEQYFGELPGTNNRGWIRKNILCPFHGDRRPSFGVNLISGAYRCFSCGESGDVFKFVQKRHGRGFADAVAFLADFCGLKGDPGRREELQNEINRRRMLQKAKERFRRWELRCIAERRDLLNDVLGVISAIQRIDRFHDMLVDLYRVRDDLEWEVESCPEMNCDMGIRLERYRRHNDARGKRTTRD